MSEETKRILDMLSEGRLSVEEAERLLDALRAPGTAAVRQAHDGGVLSASKGAAESGAPEEKTGRGPKPRFLRVIVDREGRKVDVRLPLQLVRAGMRFTALIPEKARGEIEKQFSKQGVDLDLKKLGPEDLDDLIDHLGGLTVEVDEETEDGKSTVRIFCE